MLIRLVRVTIHAMPVADKHIVLSLYLQNSQFSEETSLPTELLERFYNSILQNPLKMDDEGARVLVCACACACVLCACACSLCLCALCMCLCALRMATLCLCIGVGMYLCICYLCVYVIFLLIKTNIWFRLLTLGFFREHVLMQREEGLSHQAGRSRQDLEAPLVRAQQQL